MNMPKFNTWNDYFNWMKEQAVRPTPRPTMRKTAKIHNPCVRNRPMRHKNASAFVQWMVRFGLAPYQLSAQERKEGARHGMLFTPPNIRNSGKVMPEHPTFNQVLEVWFS